MFLFSLGFYLNLTLQTNSYPLFLNVCSAFLLYWKIKPLGRLCHIDWYIGTSVVHQPTRRRFPEDCNLNRLRCNNLRNRTFLKRKEKILSADGYIHCLIYIPVLGLTFWSQFSVRIGQTDKSAKTEEEWKRNKSTKDKRPVAGCKHFLINIPNGANQLHISGHVALVIW